MGRSFSIEILAAFSKTLAEGSSPPDPDPTPTAPPELELEAPIDELFEVDAIDLSGSFRLKKSTKNERNRREWTHR